MRKIILAGLLILVLVSFGCKRGQPGIDGPIVINYHKGNDGLEVKFLDNLPPDEIVVGSKFLIGLEVKNQGAFDVTFGSVLISGIDDYYVSVERNEYYIEIDGKKPGFPNGGFEIINIEAQVVDIPALVTSYPILIRAITKYRYETEAGLEVCITPDIYGYVAKNPVCEVKEIILSGGQGAPVVVTKIRELVSPFGNNLRVDFDIEIENKGDGKVEGKVFIKDVRLSSVPIPCSESAIELDTQKKGFFVCTSQTQVSAGAYLAPLSINLVYDYVSAVDKKIKVKSLTKR